MVTPSRKHSRRAIFYADHVFICDFLLVFHCNYMPIFYRFLDLTIYWSKFYGYSLFLSIPVSFDALARGASLGPRVWKNRSPWAIGSENRTILRSLVLTHYQRVTEYRTYPPGHIPHGHFPHPDNSPSLDTWCKTFPPYRHHCAPVYINRPTATENWH